MKRNAFAIAGFFALLFLFQSNFVNAQSSNRVVSYFTNWAQYRPGSCKFTPQNIQPQYFTHINYAFAKIDANNQVQPVEWNDAGSGGMYEQVNVMKVQYPNLKTLISIGGWTLSDAFPRMASNASSRATFIQSAIKYARNNGFDGMDLDWEYPGYGEHSGTAQDKVNFTSLLREFRQAINVETLPSGKSRLLLTIAAPAGEANYNNMELALIHPYLDWINLMTYDFHGSWDAYSGMNSPLMHDSTPNGHFYVDYTVTGYLNAGVPADKLVLGIPAYGRSFGPVQNNLPNSPVTNSNPPRGRCTGDVGFMSYYEVNELLKSGTYQYSWDTNTDTPYAYDGSGNWVSYDNDVSVGKKLSYLQSKSLGGAMVWAMDLDDNYALMGQIANTLRGVTPPAPSPTPTPTPTPIPIPTPTPTPDAPMSQVISPELKIDLSIDTQWGSGATMKAVITNTSSTKSFTQIQIKTNAGSGINIWSMDAVSKTGTETAVQLPSYQPGLAAGQSYHFGFTISPNAAPAFALVNAIELPPPAPPAPPAPIPAPTPTPSPSPTPTPSPLPGNGAMTQILANGLTLTLHIDSQWGTTESWAGASVTATLKNSTASTTFNPLRIAADMGAGLSIWSMDAVSKTSAETVVQLPSWQKSLKPGKSFVFGFNISPIRIPNFSLR